MPQLRRVLGTTFGLALVVGATIGGGILHTPGDVAAALPAAALIMTAWALGAVNILLGGALYAELGAMMSKAGGPYVFADRAFGRRVGSLVGYADFLNWAVSSAALLLLAGEYMGGLIPPLQGHTLLAGLLAFAVLAIVQWRGVVEGGRAQELTTVLKTVGFVVLIIAAFMLPHATAVPPQVTPVVPHGIALFLAFGIAMQGIVFTYDNYYTIVYCGEEIREPGREIPQSIFRGSALIIVLYMLINAAFLHVVPAASMAGDPFVGATVARSIFGAHGDTIIRLIMVVSVLGTVNAQIMAAPRVALALARKRLFPAAVLKVNDGGTPTTALALTLVLVLAFVLTGSFNAVLGIDSFLIVSIYLVVFGSFFVLRRREPDAERPYRAPGYPWLPGLAVVASVVLLVAMALGDWKSAVIMAALVGVCWPLSRMLPRAN
ncbi:MAG TPA: APC family permease [Gemmatimonadales bacterium]|jgi:APA family basic amino acid/polyamine antiporter